MTTNKQSRQSVGAVNGLLLLNKPAGLTSNQALQKVKHLLKAKKAGHTGSLDPAATGMLPLCFGEATKVCAYLLDADKSYRVTARLGVATDTADADGKEVDTAPVPDLSIDDWRAICEGFIGEIEQIPPMYSALKKDGKRLYELARKGEVVERQARKIRIHEIQVLESSGSRLVLRVHCSKGTYIRTLVEDLAKAAGTVAHTARLHRETVGDLPTTEMLDLAGAEKVAETGVEALRALLLPADAALQSWPERCIADASVEHFVGGQSVQSLGPEDQDQQAMVRVYAASGGFLGIGETGEGSSLAPRRIFRLED